MLSKPIIPAPGETITIEVYGNIQRDGDFFAFIARNGRRVPIYHNGKTAEEAERRARDFWVSEVEKEFKTRQDRARAVAASQQARSESRERRAAKKQMEAVA